MEFLILLIVVIVFAIKDKVDTDKWNSIPPGQFNNLKKIQEDQFKVSVGDMSVNQFRKNWQNGKYK